MTVLQRHVEIVTGPVESKGKKNKQNKTKQKKPKQPHTKSGEK